LKSTSLYISVETIAKSAEGRDIPLIVIGRPLPESPEVRSLLANVSAYLLEPESDDGLVTWNFLDRYLVPQWGRKFNPLPVCKIMKSTSLNTIPY